MAPAPAPEFATVLTGSPEPPLWPISVELYGRMVAAGLLGKGERAYLWNGRLAPRMTIHRPHTIALIRVTGLIQGLLPAGVHIETEQPLAFRLSPSVPQPDLVVLRGRAEDYPDRFPTTAETLLLVEVAESSLDEVRRLALSYAAEGVPVYWVVNLTGRRVEVFSEPAEGAYTRCTPYVEADAVPVVLDGVEVGRVAVREILP
jgi:hypothetical protein